MVIIMPMTETSGNRLDLVRLMQLASPGLPVGGFHYSQGLETCVEDGWVSDLESFSGWLHSMFRETLVHLEIPLLKRLSSAFRDGQPADFDHWCCYLMASRETREFRLEEKARGQAMLRLMDSLAVEVPATLRSSVGESQLAGFAVMCQAWGLELASLATAYAFSMLENQVTAGIKLIPLGQSDGQRTLFAVGSLIPVWVEQGLAVRDEEIGASTHALGLVSSRHEIQYTRLFRS